MKEKYGKLLIKSFLQDDIYCGGIAIILKVLKWGLHVFRGTVPNIVHAILFF
jgi:hypothetical protein